jgi:poly-gamma-glutamate synthase PgsB/CapB
MVPVILLVITLILTIYCFFEYKNHLKNLYSIPIRIHVNGTRGKSSVTRLIAAGLREGNIRCYAKTTGSLPKVITHDGTEYPVFRNAKANIIEQLRIVSFAATNKAEALVIECMALQPNLQSMSELKFIKATHGVITNAREDHLDVMGPGEKDVALALLGTTPVKAKLFTAERDYLDLFKTVSKERNSDLIYLDDEMIERIDDNIMSKFSYVEHKENVALALKVCEEFGIPEDVAVKGMQAAKPDVGAMNDLTINFFGRTLYFINGVAANDPESTEKLWNMTLEKHSHIDKKIMIINSRIDRSDRSKQFGLSIPHWEHADYYFLMGSGSYFLIKEAVKRGLTVDKFINVESISTENIVEEILSYCDKKTLIVGVGNIANQGLELIKYFSNRSNLE